MPLYVSRLALKKVIEKQKAISDYADNIKHFVHDPQNHGKRENESPAFVTYPKF